MRRLSAGVAAATRPLRHLVAMLREFDAADWFYLAATISGVVGLLASPAPWLAGLWMAGCLFVLVRLAS